MSRANDGGWDFIKEGNIYQYKEDSFIAMVYIIEDQSNDKYYHFLVEVLASNLGMVGNIFTVSHTKTMKGFCSGMLQFYKNAEYIPLPIGTPWGYAKEDYEFCGIEETKGLL